MKEISEFTLIGNYLIMSADKFGQDSIKYETAKLFSEKVIQKLNKNDINYTLLPLDKKMDIVRKMISSGVFKTDHNNKITPFKQVYNYEISKHILAVYTCDGNLVFKLAKSPNNNKDFIQTSVKQIYTSNLSLELKNAIDSALNELKPKTK